jgi:hypothetical protein
MYDLIYKILVTAEAYAREFPNKGVLGGDTLHAHLYYGQI